MTRFLRPAAVILCMGLLAAGVVVFHRSYLHPSPLTGNTGLQPSMAEVLARREQLERLEEASDRRRQAKRLVAEEVITRRRSLREAIDEFRALDRPWLSADIEQHMLQVRGISEDEWRGGKVLHVVGLVLADRPEEAAAVADRLEKELRQLLADRTRHPADPADPRTEEQRR